MLKGVLGGDALLRIVLEQSPQQIEEIRVRNQLLFGGSGRNSDNEKMRTGISGAADRKAAQPSIVKGQQGWPTAKTGNKSNRLRLTCNRLAFSTCFTLERDEAFSAPETRGHYT